MNGRKLDVLFAMLPTGGRAPLSGGELTERLRDAGRDLDASTLLGALLALESSGHVLVQRQPYRFALTELGETAAHDLGPGRQEPLRLVMLDLVDYVGYTATAGDVAAHGAAQRMCEAAATALERNGGWLVKGLGDGFLGAVDPSADPVSLLRHVRAHCTRHDGTSWPVRAAAHLGAPIRHRNDLFGGDVNLVARLCGEARPDELVVSVADPGPGEERVAIRGLDAEVAVRRVALT